MEILDCEQGTPEWFEARAGIPTASCFDKIITPKTLKPSKSAENYLYQLAGERLSGMCADTYQSAAMARGSELEAEARLFFEIQTGLEVQQVGIVYPDEKRQAGASPDGLMPEIRKGLEIKCPVMHTHIAYLLSKDIPRDYIAQVQGSMWVTGYSSWYFMSYYPGLPPLIVEVERDDKFCAALKVELDAFCERLNEVEGQLREMAA